MKLTNKQQRFCEEYLIDLNATQSAIRAGYSKKTAYIIGHENLNKPNIEKYITKLMKKREDRTEITADMVIKELALLAFSDTGNLFENNSLKHISDLPSDVTRTLQEVTSRVERTGSGEDTEYADIIKVKSYDKKGALDSLGKHFGIFEKDNNQTKTEIAFENGTLIAIQESLKE